MTIIIKEPGKNPEYVKAQNKLKPLQKLVGGYIEPVRLRDDLILICNEEGRLRGLPWCCTVFKTNFYGTVLFAGVDGEEFTDCPLTIEELEQFYGVN